ncbi:MAG: hypothetical protein WA655_02100, partial [Candidatus Korobacteraceae bacterium]
MTVQSLTYILFVPLVWLLWRTLRSRTLRKAVLLSASYFFYATWGAGFLALLVFSSLVNYALGECLRRKPDPSRLLWMRVVCAELGSVADVEANIMAAVTGCLFDSDSRRHHLEQAKVGFCVHAILTRAEELFRP